MGIKRKGILQKPGAYYYGDKQEYKSAEELKAAAERQPSIPLTIGHPPECLEGKDPLPEHIVGRVDQRWFNGQNRAIGDFLIFDEKKDMVPESILERLEHGQPVAISPGFWRDMDASGIQKNIRYTHVGLLRDEENPRCPLHTCGVNLKTDSIDERQRALVVDQKTEILELPKEESVKPVPEQKPAVEEKPVQERAKEPQDKAVEKKSEPEIPKKEPVKEVPLVPEVAIPVSQPSSHKDYAEEDGWVKYVPKPYRIKEEK